MRAWRAVGAFPTVPDVAVQIADGRVYLSQPQAQRTHITPVKRLSSLGERRVKPISCGED